MSHTEILDSWKIVWHEAIHARTEAALTTLDIWRTEREEEQEAKSDAAVVRATPIFWYSGSYAGTVFDYSPLSGIGGRKGMVMGQLFQTSSVGDTRFFKRQRLLFSR